jgi:hypothetical protein
MEARLAELKAQLADVETEQKARPNLHSLPDGEWQAEMEARKPLGRKRAEIAKAITAQEKAIQGALWEAATMIPVPFLAELRNVIVNGPEPPKRTPKWRFKVADDFALQLQAKDKERVLFEGVALEGDGITGDSFKENRSEHRHLWQLKFDIRPDGDLWRLKPTSARYGAMNVEGRWAIETREMRESVGMRALTRVKGRIIEALGSMFKDGQVPLLEDYCLMCGRALTDPVSRSRHIGPECWGSSSNLVPLHIGRLLTEEEAAR